MSPQTWTWIRLYVHLSSSTLRLKLAFFLLLFRLLCRWQVSTFWLLILFRCIVSMMTNDFPQRLGNIFKGQVVRCCGYRFAACLQNILQVDVFVPEDLQVICYQVSSLTPRTLYEHRPFRVSLFRKDMRRSGFTFFARKRDHELRVVDFQCGLSGVESGEGNIGWSCEATDQISGGQNRKLGPDASTCNKIKPWFKDVGHHARGSW